MPQRLYTLFQVADLLGSTLGEVESWISKGRLLYRRMPEGSVRVSEENLVAFLQSQGIDLGEVMSRIARSEQELCEGPAASVRPDRPPGAGAGPRESAPAEAVHPYQAEGRSETWHTAGPDRRGEEAALPPPPVAKADPVGAPSAVASAKPPSPPQGQLERESVPPPEAIPPGPAAEADQAEAEPPDPDADIPASTAGPLEFVPPAGETGPAEAGNEAEPPEAENEAEPPPAMPSADPVWQVVSAVLNDALDRRASHIHLVSDRDGLSLRLRIDGVLHEKAGFRRRLRAELAAGVVEAVLDKAGLDAGELRRPMRGSFLWPVRPRGVTFVVDTTPTIQGRRVVIHVRDPRQSLLRLGELGLAQSQRERVEELLTSPAGVILVAGPPRSGRRTTLRAMAMALRDAQRDVVMVDRAADVEVPGVCQSVADPAGGFSCAEAIDALARQRPDVLVVGELLRPEEVQAAVEAARGGVLVLAGVYGPAPRVAALPVEMGADPFDAAAVLLAVTEQRLVRRICTACRRPAPAAAELPCGLTEAELRFPLFDSPGCPRCSHTGHAGRLGLFSLLEVDEEVAGVIRRAGSAGDIARAARAGGDRTLRGAIAQALREGLTSPAEIRRVLGRR